MSSIESQVRRTAAHPPEARAGFGEVVWLLQGGKPSSELSFALATLDAGGGNEEHTHPNAEEAVYVLEGEVTHTLGDETTVLRAGDLLLVPRDVPHRLYNDTATPARCIIVFSAPDRDFLPTGR